MRPGTRLGPYEIVAAIGAGGMGEVYKARDTRLERDVAVKVLPVDLTDSAPARERFQREARAVAALQHPNICTIHDVGETRDGQAFLVMELLQGETVQRRLARGPLDVALLVDVGMALADALDAAHSAGILHRDVKPANIFLTARGPKVLDFGLAKAAPRPPIADSMTRTREPSPLLTEPGSIVGTVAYMSPEQLRGEDLDVRTDLFSFGLVLYEMTTGRPAFAGATSAVISAAILHHEPPGPRLVRPDLPARLEDVILKAIEKDRKLRYQRASDIRTDLQRLKRDTDSAQVITSAKSGGKTDIARRWKMIVPAAAAVLALVVAGYVYFHRTLSLTDKDTIILADFRNTTGDAVFDETLRQGLAVQLGQSPFLSLVSDQRIRNTLGLMGQPADARLTPELARDVCERTASAAVLEGSIASLGSQYVVGLVAKNCRTGEVLDEEQGQAARKEDVLNVLSQLATTFRTRVGESLSTVEKHDTPLEEATTPSLEALKAYSGAYQLILSTGCGGAVPFLKRVVDIDPKFAMAHAQLGLCYSTTGESVLSKESTSTAYQLRDRTSDRERFFITAMYDRQVTGNLEKALQTFELWAQTYPRDPLAHGLFSGFSSQGSGKFELTIEEARKAIALDPDGMPAHANLAAGHMYLGQLEEAEGALRRASERKLESFDFLHLRYHIAFLKGDTAGMDREATLATGKRGAALLVHTEALVLARSGQLQRARSTAGRAINLAQQAGQGETAALYATGVAVWEAFFGNAPAAKRRAMEALELSKGRDVEYGAALALALVGDSSQAEALANDLDSRFPEDTSVQFNYLPTLRALSALNQGESAKAIGLLQVTIPYELAIPGISFTGSFGGTLHPAYVRGAAYLSAHQGPEAATEFQKLLTHRGIVLSDPIGAMARLQLGRAFVLSGDAAKAKTAYQDFLTLWNNADPDILILKQARAEYAKLQ